MKNRLFPPLIGAVLGLLTLATTQAQTTYNWAPSGADPVTGGTGTWNGGSARWTTSAYGSSGASYVAFTPSVTSQIVNFGGTAGTVTLNVNPTSLTSMLVSTSNYIFELTSTGNSIYVEQEFGGAGFSSATFRPDSTANRTFNIGVRPNSIGNISAALTDNGTRVLSVRVGLSGYEGTYVLSGDNTYTGSTQLNIGGTTGVKLAIDADNRLGTAPASPTADHIHFNATSGTGSLRFTDTMTLNANRGIGLGAAGSSSASLASFEVDYGHTATYAGIMTNHSTNTGIATIFKTGPGTLVLQGANGYTGFTRFVGGRLVLDYASVSSVVNSATALEGRGGTLEFRGRTGVGNSTAQTVGAVTTLANTALSTIELNRNDGDGVTITTGTFTPSATRSALLVRLGNSANSYIVANNLSGALASSQRLTIQDGTGRYDFAINSGANTALTALNATTDLVSTPLAVNYRLTGSQTITTNSQQIASLRIDPSSAGQILTLSQGTSTQNTRVGNLMFVGDHDFTITQSAGQTGSMGVGGATSNQQSLVLYHYGTGKLTLDTKVAGGNNDPNGTGSFEMYGAGQGLIEWTRQASSSGFVVASGVTLRMNGTNGQLLSNVNSGLGSGNIMLGQGGIVEISGATNFTRDLGTGAGQVQWVGDGGFSAFGGTRNIQLNNGTGTVTWETTFGLNSLILGSNFSNGMVNFQNGINLGVQSRNVIVNNGTVNGDVDGRFSGVLSGVGGLNKHGLGTLELTNDNTYTGNTLVTAGTLLLKGSTSAASAVRVQSGATLGGDGVIGGSVTIDSGAFLSPGNSPGSLDVGDGLTINGTYVWEIDANSTATGFDSINLTGGDLLLGGGSVFNINILGGVDFTNPFWATAQQWVVINSTGGGSRTGSFGSLTGMVSNSFGSFNLSYGVGADSNVYLNWSGVPIPEPSTAWLILMGGLAIHMLRRKRS